MRLDELKYHIVNKEVLPNLLIFKYRKGSINSKFLFHQYLNEYSKNLDLNIVVKEDLSEFTMSGLFDISEEDNNIYICEVPKLETLLIDKNKVIWILCNTISNDLEDLFKDNIIKLIPIEDWQIKDYIEFNLSFLSDKEKDKLYSNYRYDLFRLELEIDKLKLVNDDVWYNKIKDQLFVDSTEYSIFDITNCILRRDKNKLLELKHDINIIDIDPFGFIKILITNFKQVIDIQLAKNSTPEYVGVSNKQFWAIKNYSCNHYSKEELVSIYKFLLGLDNKIKSGYINTDCIIDYVICKIMFL